MDLFISRALSLGVGKRQIDEVSLKTALISLFYARSKMLKMSSPGFKRNSPNIIFTTTEKNKMVENESFGFGAPRLMLDCARFSCFQSQLIVENVFMVTNLDTQNAPCC